MKLMDVTLRESVYYGKGLTNNDALEYVQMLKKNISNRYIQYVEVGYINNDTEAPLNYDEDYFNKVIDLCHGTFLVSAMMHIPKATIAKWNPKVIQRLDIVRVVVGHHVPDELKEYIRYFHDLGVKVSANLTYTVGLSDEKLISEVNRAADMGVDYFFCADSSGSYTANSAVRISSLLTSHCKNMIPGVHLHDHMQMALSNALTVQANGIEMTDVSVTGAGKGGGNLKMEQALLLLYGTDVVDYQMLCGLNNMVVYFAELIGRDGNFYSQALIDFLTGVYRLSLKDTDYLEQTSRLNAEHYFRLITENYHTSPID